MKETYQKRALALLIAIGILFLFSLTVLALRQRPATKEYEIYSDNRLVLRLNLNLPDLNREAIPPEDIRESSESVLRFVLHAGNGGMNEIMIDYRTKTVCVTASDCPDHLCEKMTIESVPIVCLPNRLVITAVSSDSSIDAETY